MAVHCTYGNGNPILRPRLTLLLQAMQTYLFLEGKGKTSWFCVLPAVGLPGLLLMIALTWKEVCSAAFPATHTQCWGLRFVVFGNGFVYLWTQWITASTLRHWWRKLRFRIQNAQWTKRTAFERKLVPPHTNNSSPQRFLKCGKQFGFLISVEMLLLFASQKLGSMLCSFGKNKQHHAPCGEALRENLPHW